MHRRGRLFEFHRLGKASRVMEMAGDHRKEVVGRRWFSEIACPQSDLVIQINLMRISYTIFAEVRGLCTNFVFEFPESAADPQTTLSSSLTCSMRFEIIAISWVEVIVVENNQVRLAASRDVRANCTLRRCYFLSGPKKRVLPRSSPCPISRDIFFVCILHHLMRA